MIRRYITAALALLPMLVACTTPALPKVSVPSLPSLPIGHRIDVQQGNVITQEMLGQLEVGMEKKKVLFIMGSPVIMDTFHADRWDYVYTFQKGRHQAKLRKVELYFTDDKLVRIGGDVKPAAGPLNLDTRGDETVTVPDDYHPGIVAKLKNSLPFVGDGVAKKAAAEQAKGDKPVAASKDAQKTADAGDAIVSDEVRAAPTVVVPADAPKKKKGFFARLFSRDNVDDDDEE